MEGHTWRRRRRRKRRKKEGCYDEEECIRHKIILTLMASINSDAFTLSSLLDSVPFHWNRKIEKGEKIER